MHDNFQSCKVHMFASLFAPCSPTIPSHLLCVTKMFMMTLTDSIVLHTILGLKKIKCVTFHFDQCLWFMTLSNANFMFFSHRVIKRMSLPFPCYMEISFTNVTCLGLPSPLHLIKYHPEAELGTATIVRWNGWIWLTWLTVSVAESDVPRKYAVCLTMEKLHRDNINTLHRKGKN